MKDYELTYIIGRVRNILDQNTDTDSMSVFGDAETLELDEVIIEQVCAGARLIELAAPIGMLGKGYPGQNSVVGVSSRDSHIGIYGLPANFLREVYFKMYYWEVGITSFSDVGSKDYFMLHSRNADIVLSSLRPVAILVPSSVSGANRQYNIEVYRTRKEDNIEDFSFITEPSISKASTVSLCDKLEEPILYAIASLVANSFGAVQQSMNLMSTAKALAGITEPAQQVQPNNQSE